MIPIHDRKLEQLASRTGSGSRGLSLRGAGALPANWGQKNGLSYSGPKRTRCGKLTGLPAQKRQVEVISATTVSEPHKTKSDRAILGHVNQAMNHLPSSREDVKTRALACKEEMKV